MKSASDGVAKNLKREAAQFRSERVTVVQLCLSLLGPRAVNAKVLFFCVGFGVVVLRHLW